MRTLNLELFVGSHSDFESRRYHILDALATIRRSFSQNCIYPTLAELIELHSLLRKIAQQTGEMRLELPRRIKGIDLETRRIIYEYESLNLSGTELKAVAELIDWAMPHIQQAIEEGQTIYNFVDEHLTVEGVGIVPSYIEEGYLLVPDLKSRSLHVLRYEISIFSGSDQRYRNLKTTAIKTLPLGALDMTPWSIKHDLIAENREMPNPATYLFETDIDFPYQETLLPVAKRKLLRKIYS